MTLHVTAYSQSFEAPVHGATGVLHHKGICRTNDILRITGSPGNHNLNRAGNHNLNRDSKDLLRRIRRFLKTLLMCFGVLVFLPGNGASREYPATDGPGPGELVQQIAETLDPDDFESDEAMETYLQELLDLFPVNLNTASRQELFLIPGITDRIANALIAWRADHTFTAIDDLVKVPGIGPVTAGRLRPWVTVGPERSASTRSRRSGNGRHFGAQQFFRYQQSFPAASGYIDSGENPAPYAGSPSRLYHRQTVRTNRFAANLTQVKLPGEPYAPPHGFDFTSAHLSYDGTGILRRVIIGDYSARFGQGLVLWNSSSFGKGGPAHMAPFRRSHGITPYRSSGQTAFFRGAATELKVPLPGFSDNTETGLFLSILYSSRHRSAVEVNGDTIRPPSSNPYHRTENERLRRNNVRETVMGSNITLVHSHGNLGFTWTSCKLNRPVIPHPNSSPMQGSPHQAMGIDGTFQTESVRFFGEYAWRAVSSYETERTDANTHHRSWTTGIMASYPVGADWVFAVRNYHPGYWAAYANGFGEGTAIPSNQSGWYLGMRLRPLQGLHLSFFLDRFQFPEPTRGSTKPGHGWESMFHIQYRYRPGMEYQIRLRYKERSAELDVLDDFHRKQRTAAISGRLNGRFQMSWQVHPTLVIRSRYDAVLTSLSGVPRAAVTEAGAPEAAVPRAGAPYNTGVSVSKTVRWRPSKALRFDLGWALFDTDDYSSRLYLYEFDLTHVMTSRMLSGVGRQSYAVMRLQPFTWLLAELKYTRIRYFDRPAVGSGNDQTPGPIRSELGIQFRLTY